MVSVPGRERDEAECRVPRRCRPSLPVRTGRAIAGLHRPPQPARSARGPATGRGGSRVPRIWSSVTPLVLIHHSHNAGSSFPLNYSSSLSSPLLSVLRPLPLTEHPSRCPGVCFLHSLVTGPNLMEPIVMVGRFSLRSL